MWHTSDGAMSDKAPVRCCRMAVVMSSDLLKMRLLGMRVMRGSNKSRRNSRVNYNSWGSSVITWHHVCSTCCWKEMALRSPVWM